MLPDGCLRCARRIGEECIAFASPHLMWRDGPCWGYTESVERVERELMDCVEYAGQRGGKIDDAKRLLHRYQRYYGLRERMGA